MGDILITEFMAKGAVEALKDRFEVLYDPLLVDEQARLEALLPKARALIVRNRTQVTASLLDHAAGLKVVGRLGVGLDNIDQEACRARGIEVIPALGANTLSVAEYVITAALLLRRRAYLSTADVLAGEWPRNRLMGEEGAGAVMGLVGFGAIAQATAERARALGFSVIAHDPHVPENDPAWSDHGVAPQTFETVLTKADVISLHVPLTDETRGLFGAQVLAKLKPSTILINTARGGVVDEASLADALRAGRLGGAALDVFATEPLPADNPFKGLDNFIATPHIAGVTVQSNERVSALIAEKVAAALS